MDKGKTRSWLETKTNRQNRKKGQKKEIELFWDTNKQTKEKEWTKDREGIDLRHKQQTKEKESETINKQQRKKVQKKEGKLTEDANRQKERKKGQ